MTELSARDDDERSPVFSGTVYATTVAIGGRAIAIRGDSGSGKSDLALRLIDRGAVLLSDDYTHIEARDGRAIASPAPNIAGLIEVRGLGPMAMPYVDAAPVALVVALAPPSGPPPERCPSETRTTRLCGVDLPLIHIHGLDASAPIKVELALKAMGGQGVTS